MKNLKLGLLSLLAVLAVSAFLTSCEQDVITEQIDTALEQEENYGADYTELAYKLPKGYDEWTEVEINNYMSELTEVEFNQLIENNRISTFLVNENLWESVDATLTYGEILSKVNVLEYLTDKQIQALNGYTFQSEIDLRACGPCEYAYTQCASNGCKAVNGLTYPHRKVYERTCSGKKYICKRICSF